jgi:MtrB/PioB family decaheme-associated outer membrane protein
MTVGRRRLAARIWVGAARSGLITTAMLAPAQAAEPAEPADPAVADLVRPASTVELGAGYVSRDSFKFGEYNGLEKKGLYGIANIDLRGGAAYDSGDATRWRVTGTDLGLHTRELNAEYGRQGSFRINLGYDELQKNRSDSYQTPYLGVGGSALTLPSSWLVPAPYGGGPITVNGVTSPTTVVNGVLQPPIVVNGLAQPVSQANIKVLGLPEYAGDVAAFRHVDLATRRRRSDLGFTLQLTPQWELSSSVRHEKKTGLKAVGGLLTSGGDKAMWLPEPVHASTSQFDASVAFRGERGTFALAYYGSVYKNDVDALTFQNAFQNPSPNPSFVTPGAPAAGRLGSAPDNHFHQLNLSGGYAISRSARLAATASYGRASQNQAFLPSDLANTYALPRASLDGLVVNQAASLKLTVRAAKDLNLAANLKYDHRDNRTPIATYQMLNDGDSGPLNVRRNTPFSRKLKQLNLDADYALGHGRSLKAGYDRQLIERSCAGAWFDCAIAPHTAENTVRLEWRTSTADALSARIGYAHSERKASGFDQDASILASLPQSAALDALLARVRATGYPFWGPQQGALNAGSAAAAAANPLAVFGVAGTYDLLSMIGKSATTGGVAPWSPIGMGTYNMSDRNRHKLRASLDYNASETLSFQGSIDVNQDTYSNSQYGLKEARSHALNLEASFRPTEMLGGHAFYSYENARTLQAGNAGSANAITGSAVAGSVAGGCFTSVLDKNLNAKADPCLQWSGNLRNQAHTVGAGFTYTDLMRHKLELAGDILFSRATTRSDFTGGAYAVPVAAGVTATTNAVFYPGVPTPDIRTNLAELKLGARYALSKVSALRVNYLFQRLDSANYLYDSVQYGSLQGVLPTNEQAPHYNVHVIGVSYVYVFN